MTDASASPQSLETDNERRQIREPHDLEASAPHRSGRTRPLRQKVAESRKQFGARGTLHRPLMGRVALSAMRTGLRVVNNVPILKRRMVKAENAFHGVERDVQAR